MAIVSNVLISLHMFLMWLGYVGVILFFKSEVCQKSCSILGNCVEEGYIESDEEKFFVTKKGRNLVPWPGFFEECLKRRRRLTAIIFSTVIFTVVIELIRYFWPKISSVL